jgi:hypothetical protein
MSHDSHAFLTDTSTEPADLSGSHSEHLGSRAYIESSSLQASQNLHFPLLFAVQGDGPIPLVSDIFPEQ